MTPVLQLLQLCVLALASVVMSSNDVDVSVNFKAVRQISRSTPTLQVVTNPLLARDSAFQSPIAKIAFENLKKLNSQYTRYVPWFPFPKRAVAELEPPSSAEVGLCAGPANVNYNISLDCTNGGRIKDGKIESIVFANYGLPTRLSDSTTKMCTSFTENKTCSHDISQWVAESCVGQSGCLIVGVKVAQQIPNVCPGIRSDIPRRVAVHATCSKPFNFTSWNFDILDPMMDSFFENTPQDGFKIPNFSTQPAWMFDDADTWSYVDDPNANDNAYASQGTSNGSEDSKRLISDYYRRLVQYYTAGGFFDEFGEYVKRRSKTGNLDIRMWEIFNEPESEHSHTPESYTAEYDAVAAALVEEIPGIQLVGLALCRHGESAKSWLSYFLNISNHRTIRGLKPKLDWISYHQYATSCKSSDPKYYQQCFFTDPESGADMFIEEVRRHNEIKDHLAPHVKTTVDEIGTMLPGEVFDPLYWCASAAYNVYLYLTLMKENIEVIGWSQLTAYPTISELGLEARDPSVAMLNYSTGEGNARYQTLKLMIEYTGVGDRLVETVSSDASNVYAQGFLHSDQHEEVKTIVLLNKNVEAQRVKLSLYPKKGIEKYHDMQCETFSVDEESGDGKPRQGTWDGTEMVRLNPFAVMVVRCGGGMGV